MPRLSHKKYQQQAMLAMTAYVGFMLLAWPLTATVASVPLKILLALLPLAPMLYVIGLMARRIRDSDELEQRTHLVALGVATAVVAALSLGGGFLASAHLFQLDGTILIWVFPALMVCYGATRWWVARGYGVTLGCSDDGAVPMGARWLLMAAVLAGLAFFAHARRQDHGAGALAGMAAVFAAAGVVLAIRRWRRRGDARSL
jgi:hypothetical protein